MKWLKHKVWILFALLSAMFFISLVFYLSGLHIKDISEKNSEIAKNNIESQKKKVTEYVSKVENHVEKQTVVQETEAENLFTGIGMTNLHQGIQVKIEGIEVDTKFFNYENHYNIEKKYSGLTSFQPNHVAFDPDYPNRGYPNLYITVLEPKPFSDKSFLERMTDGSFLYSGANFTGKQNSKIDAFYWKTDNHTLLIEEHALQFALDVYTHFDEKNYRKGYKKKYEKDVFGEDIKNNYEWDNIRYPHIKIALSFNPQSPELAAEKNVSSPKFAVAAVELIRSQDYAYDKKSKGEMGSAKHFTAGFTLPLYPEFELLPLSSNRDNLQEGSSKKDLRQDIKRLKGSSSDEVVNSKFFNKTQYSLINIANIGTLSKGNFFLGEKRTSEAYRFVFAIHLFAYGDWVTQYTPLASEWGGIEEKAQLKIKDSLIDRALSGLVDTFIPTFGIGSWGQYLFIGICVFLAIPFVPVLLQVVLSIASFFRLLFR
ncbi:hypothetical protein [Vibrio barjaei]|uniref:hypothetical protein n=1 Tax=Vibrio barjaei TaxID=1676683 RepID=UPI0007BB09B4|nr:hypothetical protein [Vibrio barjaei]OIN27384.1 hypothetical protein AWH66_2011825 [Vibrio barjaei]